MAATTNLAPGLSPEELALRRKLALSLYQQGGDTSPVAHPMQAIARAFQGGMAGWELGQLREDEEKERTAGRDAMIALLGGGPPSPPAAGGSTPRPAQTTTPAPDVPATFADRFDASFPRPPANIRPVTRVSGPRTASGERIYSNDEPSPLDPPSGNDRDLMIRTIYGEAAGEPPAGQLAVANVIRNRAVAGNYGGDTVPGVVLAKNQFEPWNRADARARMQALSPSDPRYQQIGSLVDQTYTGASDPTNGATHFFSPRVQAALGRPVPSWGAGQGQDIGTHRFFRHGVTPPPGGGPSPAALDGTAQAYAPPQAEPARAPMVAALQQQSDAAPPPAGIAGGISQQQRAQLASMLNNRATSPMAQQIIGNIIQQQLSPTDPKWEKIGKDEYGNEVYGWVNPRGRQVTPVPLSQPEQTGQSKIPPVPAGVDPREWRKQFSTRLTEEAMPAKPEDVQRLRKEVQDIPSYKNLAQSAPVYRSMVEAAGRDNRAADVNLIYGMAKLMDPGSVVRESEMTVAQAIATLPQNLQAQIKSQIQATGRLSAEVRAELMQEAHSRVRAYADMFNRDATQFRGIAERNRMNVDDVLPDFGTFEPFKPPQRADDGGADLQKALEEARRRGLIK